MYFSAYQDDALCPVGIFMSVISVYYSTQYIS